MIKPTVGQTLYVLNIGNNARGNEHRLRPVVVISVGRKYFKATTPEYADRPHTAVQYDMERGCEVSNYTPGWKVYESEQAWADEKEAATLEVAISKRFAPHRSGVSLKALREIMAILAADKP